MHEPLCCSASWELLESKKSVISSSYSQQCAAWFRVRAESLVWWAISPPFGHQNGSSLNERFTKSSLSKAKQTNKQIPNLCRVWILELKTFWTQRHSKYFLDCLGPHTLASVLCRPTHHSVYITFLCVVNYSINVADTSFLLLFIPTVFFFKMTKDMLSHTLTFPNLGQGSCSLLLQCPGFLSHTTSHTRRKLFCPYL
jgi:hypothetical protein